MQTARNYVFPVSRFKTHWSLRTGSPCQQPDHIVYGLTVTFEICFHPAMTAAQKADAVRYFEKAARTQDTQTLRAQFVGLFARRQHATAWEWSVAA